LAILVAAFRMAAAAVEQVKSAVTQAVRRRARVGILAAVLAAAIPPRKMVVAVAAVVAVSAGGPFAVAAAAAEIAAARAAHLCLAGMAERRGRQALHLRAAAGRRQLARAANCAFGFKGQS
jgi:hypothetical protein